MIDLRNTWEFVLIKFLEERENKKSKNEFMTLALFNN